MRRRKVAEPAPMFDIWDRYSAKVVGEAEAKIQAISRALEHERQAGRAKRPKANRLRWNINRQRVAEIRAIVQSRHDGPCDTDDAELYLQVALPHFVKLHPVATDLRIAVEGWCATLLPTLSRARVVEMIEEAEAQEWRFAKPDEIGRLLGVMLTERSKLGLRTIGAADGSKAQRLRDRKAKNAEYQRAKRERMGAIPRAKSKAATKPWEAEGISRSTYFARQKQNGSGNGFGFAANLPKPDRTVSSAIVRSTYLPVTDQSDAGRQAVEGPARQASPSLDVGAGGHSPRGKTRAVRQGHAEALPFSIEEGFEQQDLLGETWTTLGEVAGEYVGGLMPADLALAVRAAQRARMMKQEEVARHVGISRPQLANALQGRFGLSRSAAANLMGWLKAA